MSPLPPDALQPGALRSRAEVTAYLAHDRLRCLECGRSYAFLPTHLARTHQLSAETYRARWGLPAGTPLAGTAYRAQHAERVRRAIARGEFTPNAAGASHAARSRGRGHRTAWDLAEQAARAGRAASPPVLPDEARRADGRNAGRAREYQRAYVALRRGDPEPMRQYRELHGSA